MSNRTLKALIVYDRADVAKQIQAALPDYFESTITGCNNARDNLITSGGTNVNVVIMNADDKRDAVMDFYMYLCEDPDHLKFNRIPVVLITKDEFSEHSMSFYDAGNPYFYTGDVEDMDFYLAVSEAIDEAELLTDEDFIVIEEEEEQDTEPDSSVTEAISVNKILGTTIEVKGGEDEPIRAAAFNASETLKKIADMVGKNKDAAKQVLEVLEVAVAAKNVKEQNLFILPEKEERKPKEAPNTNNVTPNVMPNMMPNMMTSPNVIRQNANNMSKQTTMPTKKTILVVDIDPMTLKAFKLFLGNDIIIEQVDSSMKAIDFFVKNRADVVVVEYDMPILRGPAIINSIRMQPNGVAAKAAVLMGEERTAAEKERVLYTEGIGGVIDKPIVKKQLLSVINRLFM